MNFAVVPAAGHSTRMGQPKLALQLGGRSVIEHVVTALRSGGCEHIVVVVGPHVPELASLAESAGAHVCRLTEPTAEMRATVEHGLRWLEEQFHPRPDDPWLLAPGDHPTLDAHVVRQLLAEYARGGHSIVVPAVLGKRGHPTLLAWRHVEGIQKHRPDSGLNAYVRTCMSETLELEITGESVLCDLDTPADYERLRAMFETKSRAEPDP
jgi:molybdenum cofactor cytidylyltransferase